jgi:hypothetical protein
MFKSVDKIVILSVTHDKTNIVRVVKHRGLTDRLTKNEHNPGPGGESSLLCLY